MSTGTVTGSFRPGSTKARVNRAAGTASYSARSVVAVRRGTGAA